MFLFYVLSFFKKGDTIQRGHYSREDIFFKEIRYIFLFRGGGSRCDSVGYAVGQVFLVLKALKKYVII